jgi:hypothetical protein
MTEAALHGRRRQNQTLAIQIGNSAMSQESIQGKTQKAKIVSAWRADGVNRQKRRGQ